MNRRLNLFVVALSVASLHVRSGGAWAQAAGAGAGPAAPPPPPLNKEILTSSSPGTYVSQVDSYIAGYLGRLKSAESKAAREMLIGPVANSSSSSGFKDLYGKSLATQLLPMLGDASPQVRLTAAVVAGRAAAALAKDNDRMLPAVLKSLSDKNVGIVLHGIKGASGLLEYERTAAAVGPAATQLYGAVATAVAMHPESGEIISDVSAALKTSDSSKLGADSVKVMVGTVLKILDARAALYASKVPESADTDRDFVSFFSNKAYSLLTPAQRADVVQQAVLIIYASAQTGDTPSRTLATDVGKSLYVIASGLSGGGSAEFLKATEPFKTASRLIPPTTADLDKDADAIVAAAAKVPDLKMVKKPTLAPTSGPSTMPGK